jgi:hypothetical protein
VCKALPADPAATYLGPAAKVLAEALAKESSSSDRAALGGGLVEVCKALPADQAATYLGPAAKVLAEALAKESSPDERTALARGLAEVCKTLSANRAIPYLLLGFAQNPEVQEQLLSSLSEVSGRSLLADVVESLKQPLCYGEARQVFLRRAEQLAKRNFKTRWELVDWLTANHPEINPSTPPRMSEDVER